MNEENKKTVLELKNEKKVSEHKLSELNDDMNNGKTENKRLTEEIYREQQKLQDTRARQSVLEGQVKVSIILKYFFTLELY